MKRIITCIITSKFLLFITLLTILSFQDVKPQQDPIDLYPGIPFIAYPDRRVPDILSVNYDQMMQMGLYGIVASDLFDSASYIDKFTQHNLKVFPMYNWGDSSSNQYVIETYTNSHYTVWEAEGTESSKGNATLYHSLHTTVETDSVTYVKTLSTVQNGEEIINGPGYPQNKTYNFPEADDKVQYTAEYRMKIEQIIPNLPQDFMDNVVCTIMVTNSNSDGSNDTTIAERNIEVSDFYNGWDEWDTLKINYEFELSPTDEELLLQGSRLLPREISQCVQFKVVWRGLTYLNLYVDRVRAYDERGKQLIEQDDPKFSIATLVQNNINNHTIVGWYGTDEPFSIDNYEPYRVVDSIISAVSSPPQNNYPIRLQAGMTGAKYGGLDVPGTNYVMAQDLYVLDEFWKRAKPKKIQINCYHYYFPWDSDNDPNYVETDIDYAINTYLDRVNDYDSSFEFSVQTGAWYKYDDTTQPCVRQNTFLVYPYSSQINYDVNLGLLYGARELRGDPYYSAPVWNCDNEFVTAGLIDKNNETTGNYDLFKNIIIPRLNGWFGKTLKRLHQMEQFPGINARVYPDNIISQNYIDHIEAPGFPPSTCIIDLGFFQNQINTAEKYFMIVNRYYSTLNHFNIGLRLLAGYNNWNVTDFIDTTNFTITPSNGAAEFGYDIYPGDARLFKVYPVVKDGGSLLANETISSATILTNDMMIENGVTLTVNNNYTCFGNIYLKPMQK